MNDKSKKLTTVEAANIGRKMGVRGLIICRDEIERDLWNVITPGRCETHEPMDEATWREFIAASGWIDHPTLYDAGNGRKVTVPENDEQELIDALERARGEVANLAGRIETEIDKLKKNDEIVWASVSAVEHLRDYMIEILEYFSGVEGTEIRRSLDELHN